MINLLKNAGGMHLLGPDPVLDQKRQQTAAGRSQQRQDL